MSADTEGLLSVVVIGLNEEARLRQALEAVFAGSPRQGELEVLYVDSGSTDRSVGIANSMSGVRVLHLPGPKPSAARARNFGLRHARGRYVQLVDGDSVLHPGWMEAARRALDSQPGVACVFGQCREMHPEQSLYMRACGLDWHIPPGDHRLCGGNAMWRRSVLAAHGFFDETLPLGEEPDLCYRVRQGGGRIVCLDAPMVEHDLGMRRFGQYWRRAVNSGRAYAAVSARYWRRPEKLWLRETLVNFAEPVSWILVALVGWYWIGWAGAIGLLAAWWVLRALRVVYTLRERPVRWRDKFLYGVHCQFVRLPVAIGQARALLASK